MSTTPRGAPEYEEAQYLPEATGNEISRHVGAGAEHYAAVDKDLTSPPGTCADGARYIVAATASGAWLGMENKIAVAVGTNASSGWLFCTPVEGTTAYLQDEDLRYVYNGSAWGAELGGVLVPQITMTTSEAITGGQFVNIHNSSGAKIRKANATDDTKPVDAYAPASIGNGSSGTVYGPGTLISGQSGLTPGATYYLDTTGGAITATAPSSSGNLVQIVGRAASATQLFFNPQPGITL